MQDDNTINILAIGDIVGEPGRKIIKKHLKTLKEKLKIDFCIANGENAAGGAGLIPRICEELFEYGINVITGGDHIYDKKELYPYLRENEYVLKPANFPEHSIGRGYTFFETSKGIVASLHICGRVFMKPIVNCPYTAFDKIYPLLNHITKYIVLDFHAEATGEKVAFGYYVDGKVSLFFGTHTHIPTADEKILPSGTGYITDIGMTGPYHSVIGRQIEDVIYSFRTGLPKRFEVAERGVALSSIFSKINLDTGKCVHIERILIHDDDL
ncbi:MAG: TIGR00282 family metallophosphoesterase [Planctomycetota bacterium]